MRTENGPTDAQLLHALRGCVTDDIVCLERRPLAYRSSFPIEELTLGLDDGSEVCLVFKDLDWESQVPDALIAKPEFLFNPLREVEVYEQVLAPASLGAGYGGSIVEPAAGRYWLFLERVCGTELHQFGEIDAWKEAARWLARLHTRFSVTAGLPGSLLQHDDGFYRTWLERALVFRLKSATPGETNVLRRVAAAHERVAQRLLALPRTLLHGEFYSTNVLIQQTEIETRVIPIDWENAAIGPGLTDLAALVAGDWCEADRLAIVLAYYDALPTHGRQDLKQMLEDLRYCRLQLAIQWLGWAENWQPPPEKKHDWLSDVAQLADELAL